MTKNRAGTVVLVGSILLGVALIAVVAYHRAEQTEERARDQKQVETLMAAIHDGDPLTRVKAISAIKELPKKRDKLRFVPRLIECLADDRTVQLTSGMTRVGDFVVTGKGASIRFVSVASQAAEALSHISGLAHGKDPERWRQWWATYETRSAEQ